MRRRYGSLVWLLAVGLLLAACGQNSSPQSSQSGQNPALPGVAPVTAPSDPGGVDTIFAGSTVTIEQLTYDQRSCGFFSNQGQTFTATATGKLVSVAFAPAGSNASNVTLSVRTGNRSTLLHSQNIASFTDSGGSLVTYPLTTPVQVVSGQLYAFDIGVGCSNGSGAYGWAFNNVYAGGNSYSEGQDYGGELAFRVVIDPEPDTVITANPPAFSNSTSASFGFNGVTDPASSAVTSFECKLGSGSFVPCTPPQTYSGLSEGSHTFQVRSIDADGDKDATPAIYTWSIDTTAPTASPSLSGTAGTNGWYTSDVTVNWNWADNSGGSGVDPANCTISSTSSGEGSAVVVSATCKDKAGNTGSSSVTLKIDKTPPSITLASRLPAANPAGWNNTDVTVTWNCADVISGPVSATVSRTVSTQGSSQAASQTCTNQAGLSASDTIGGISIDKTAPTLAPVVSPNPVLRNLSATATPNAADALSGLASSSCPAVPTSSAGAQSITCTATDRAGNTTTAPASYTVLSSSQALSNLRSQVQSLSGLGFVNRTLLLATLSQAQVFLSNGVRSGAVSSLNTFIGQVDGIRGISGGLTNAQANALIAQANLIIQSINAGG